MTSRVPLKLSILTAVLAAAPLMHAQVVGEVRATDASVNGSVEVTSTGARLVSGSSLTAGQNAASVLLSRGGEVRVCANTGISVTTSNSAKDLMFALNTGAVEVHYSLDASADMIITPDFRILLAGPGTFHFAISADTRGNACIRSLAGNTSALVVSEVMGDGVYQVRARDQVFFRNGRVGERDPLIPPDCGCGYAPGVAPTMRAESAPAPSQPQQVAPAQQPIVHPQPTPKSNAAQNMELPANSAEALITQYGTLKPAEPTAQQAVNQGNISVEVDAPFIFHGDAPPPPVIAHISMAQTPKMDFAAMAQPPAQSPQASAAQQSRAAASETQSGAPKKNVFRRIGSFFKRIFT